MLETASEKKTIETIFDMLDLFYANKHMYDRLKAQERKKEQEKLITHNYKGGHTK